MLLAIFPCSVSHVGLSKWAANDIEKAAAKELSKKGVTEPDADGWVTVTLSKKHGQYNHRLLIKETLKTGQMFRCRDDSMRFIDKFHYTLNI